MSDRSIAMPVVLVALAGIGVLAGVLGFAGGYLSHSPEKEVVEVVRAPTAEELAALQVESGDKDDLSLAQIKVAELERESAVKERKVMELEARIAKGAEAGVRLREELRQVKEELEQTQIALAQAEEEKEELLVALRETTLQLEATEAELVVTKVQRDDAREDALFNRWNDFVHSAQLEICDKGNRKRLGNCREAVMSTLASIERQNRFAHCVRSGQAQPTVSEVVKGEDLPEYAELIEEDTKQVKGWFVDFCDPTLPERADSVLATGRLPATTNGG